MKESLKDAIVSSNTINEAEEKLISTLDEIRHQNPEIRVYFVSGIVTSDGPSFVKRNLQVLQDRALRIAEKVDGIVFSAANIFNSELFKKFDSAGATNEDYLIFWERVLNSGQITDVVMTPRWEESGGARRENETAITIGLQIHDYQDIIGES